MSVKRAGGDLNFGPSGLLFLFEKGKRPTRRDILSLVEDVDRTFVSHDPTVVPASDIAQPDRRQVDARGSDNWLELLRDGLTFDLLGLADGPPLAAPPFNRLVGCTVDLLHETVDAVGLFPGPHLVEGAASLPILRTHIALAADLAASLPGLSALVWTPAAVAAGPSLFVRLVDDWLEGGAFPALGLVHLEATEQGTLRSHGLGFLIGQEIELSAALSQDRIAGTRIAVRIIHELVAIGMVGAMFELAIGAEGRLCLSPSGDGTLVRIDRA